MSAQAAPANATAAVAMTIDFRMTRSLLGLTIRWIATVTPPLSK
jgi:hypothetical protein